MPRLTNKTYLCNRSALGKFWRRSEHGWSKLSLEDQCTLHEYFEPTMDLTDDQAIAYRQAVTAEWPNLPQRAGKAYAQFTRVIAQLEAEPPRLKTSPKSKHRRTPYIVRVEALARPDVDFDKLARALLAFAKEKVDRERRNS
ncbi:hypothetical protein [Microbacterium sp. 5K110]|jgi:hypothetical protein|uniref:hypothetical protein n=1 Tax=unclassified Microbacterium TaxID=2609290 RepID=UPI0010FDD94D|nr:hypothetical protein [Microbacterium sp. 5K110]TLF29172.1 hypothetical protein FE256_13140 [Microbacterium sp. 5K110]